MPTGNPLVDAVGPASYAQRQDHPDDDLGRRAAHRAAARRQGLVARPRTTPIRAAGTWSATDGKTAGTVKEAWIDQVEPQVYYWEVATAGGRTVLLPARLAVLDEDANKVRVQSITAAQFADVPGIKNPNQITLLEEDKISGYFAGGKLYADAGPSGTADLNEYETEPVRGLPERLPAGETILWQGAPRWGALARRAFHVRKIALYFAILLAWLVYADIADGIALGCRRCARRSG